MTEEWGSSREQIPENRRAPEEHLWKCSMCGKMAEDRYGIIGMASPGWDESCMLNAMVVHMDHLFSSP